MSFHIQDPTIPFSYSLHEALLQSCSGAQNGGGAYAFVSQDGVKLLLEDETFRAFIKHGSFKLIVGIDQITNENALQKLRDLRDSYKGLEIEAFYHNINSSLFHPKFTWFKNKQGGVLVVGSGNLTARGLRSNWEAFNVVQIDKKELKKVVEDWSKWLKYNARYLKSIDDPEVIEKVKLNTWGRKAKVKEKAVKGEPGIEVQDLEIEEDIKAWMFDDLDEFLIAEIPKSGNRWKQVNFNKDTFTKFFGADPNDNNHRVLFRNIHNDASLAEIEIRPSVTVRSRNYRFEIEAATDLEYPTAGFKPVVLFIRVSPRMFLYILGMPTDKFYPELVKFIDQKWKGGVREGSMRRIRGKVSELRESLQGLPLWQLKIGSS